MPVQNRNTSQEFLNLNRVRRRLFAPDPDQPIVHDPTLDLVRIAEEQKLKWNFNFTTEEPLNGTWEWSPVEPSPSSTQMTSAGNDEDQNPSADQVDIITPPESPSQPIGGQNKK